MIRRKTIRIKNILPPGYPERVSTAGQVTASGNEAGGYAESDPCAAPAGDGRPDLTWLLHRAAQNMRVAFDEAARAHGLAGARDWIVLSALSTGPRQTQLALAHSLGLAKT